MTRYIKDLLVYGKGTAFHNGNALIGRLIHSALESRNFEFWKNSPAMKTIVENGVLTGLKVGEKNSATPTRVGIRSSLVLASAGFGRSPKPKDLNPHDKSAAPAGNFGDGIHLGLDSGAILPPRFADNGVHAPSRSSGRSRSSTRKQVRYDDIPTLVSTAPSSAP